MPRMLIADDHRQISEVLKEYAKKEGYEVYTAFDGIQALEAFEKTQPHVILLDVMMPKMDGFEVCRKIREVSMVPIIMITARGEDFERIMGLDIGADDYIVKPFSPGEVMARVRALMRRIQGPSGEDKTLSLGNLFIDLSAYQVMIDKQEVLLTKKEIEIFWTLASSPGHVYSREVLLDLLWGYDYYGDQRTVDSHIKRLRSKLDVIPHPGWKISTVWGIGYKFEVEND